MADLGVFKVEPFNYRRSISEEEVRQGQITPVPVTPPPSYRSSYSDDEDSQGQITPTAGTPPPSYHSAISDEKYSQGKTTPDPATPITKGLHCKAVRGNNRIVTANSTQTLENIPEQFVLEQPGTNNTSSAPKRRRKCRVRFSCTACIIVSLFCYWLGSTIAPTLTIRDILLHPQRNDTYLKPSVTFSILAVGSSRLLFNYMWVGYGMLGMCQTDSEDSFYGPMCFMFIMCTLLSFGFSANYLFRNSVEARWALAGTDITLSFALALLLLVLLIDYCGKNVYRKADSSYQNERCRRNSAPTLQHPQESKTRGG